MDALSLALRDPEVWLGLALTAVVAYALYRFGRTLLRALEAHLSRRLMAALGSLWLLAVGVGALAVATQVAGLRLPVLSDLGRDLVAGLRHSAGQFVVVIAMALIAWKLIGSVSARIVTDDEFSRRTVRVRTLKGVIESTLKVGIVIVTLISGLQALGVNPTGLLAGVSVLGLAVGFGAQSLIKDIFTGFFILLEDQYGVGDVITVNSGQLSGTVERLNLRVTALRALDGTVHIVPNGQIGTVSVSSKDWSRVVAAVDVAYGANIDAALRVLEAVSRELHEDEAWSTFFLEAPEVQGVTRLAPEGVTIRALYRVQPKSQFALGREFNRRIKIALDQAGIPLPGMPLAGVPAAPPVTPPPPAALALADPRAAQDRQRAPVPPTLTREPEEGEL